MSFIHRNDSVNASESQVGSSLEFSNDGRENKLPPSMIYRNAVSDDQHAPRLKQQTESSNSETKKLSWRRFLVSPIAVLFAAAYIHLDMTFKLYTYNRVQNNLFPNAQINSSCSCNADKNSTNYKNRVDVQKEASSWNSYFAIAVGVPAIFSTLILGSITDRFGRKFLFVVPCIGVLLRSVYTVIGVHFNFHLEYFLIGYFVEGVTGQLFAVILISYAYVSDITPQKGRVREFAFTLLGCSFGLSSSLFSFTTGYFIQDTGFFYPMLSSVPILCMALFLVTFLPESFPKEKRSMETDIIGKLKTAYDLFFGKVNKGRRWMHFIFQTVYILTTFSILGSVTTDTLYQLNEPFCWTPKKLGYFVALRNGLQFIVAAVLIKLLQAVVSSESIAILGSVTRAIEYVMEGLAATDLVLYLVPFVGSSGILTIPILRSLMSKHTRPEQQGAIFAVTAYIETIVHLVAAVLSNTIYAHTIEFYRGFVYFVYAAVNVMCVVLISLYKYRSKPTMLT